MRLSLALCAFVLATAACGGDEVEVTAAEAGVPLVTCRGDTPFPATAIADGQTDFAERDAVVAALEAIGEEASLDAPLVMAEADPSQPEHVRLLAGDDDELHVALGEPDAQLHTAILERDGDGWQVVGWGGCQPEPALPDGSDWAQVLAPPEGLDRQSRDLTLLVTERECTSGRDPSDFLAEPTVVETATAVTISWTSDVAEGDRSCQGNPSVRRVVRLEQPLADRDLFDGSLWPARTVEDS